MHDLARPPELLAANGPERGTKREAAVSAAARAWAAAMVAVWLSSAPITAMAEDAAATQTTAPTALTQDAMFLLRHTSDVLAAAKSLTPDLDVLREVRLEDCSTRAAVSGRAAASSIPQVTRRGRREVRDSRPITQAISMPAINVCRTEAP
jgi:hypothetical protein